MCIRAREYFINSEGDVYFCISSSALCMPMSVFSQFIIISAIILSQCVTDYTLHLYRQHYAYTLVTHARAQQRKKQYVEECAFKSFSQLAKTVGDATWMHIR